MTAKRKLVFAKIHFRKFIHTMSPYRARFVELGEWDVLPPPSHPVSRREMLDRFLTTRPDLEDLRAEFDDVCRELSEFYVATSRWNSPALA